MRKLSTILFLLLVFSLRAHGACSGTSPNFTAASASSADIQACVALAVANTPTTILVPAGTVAFSGAVTIPAADCITINGQGTVTVTNVPAFILNESNTCMSRVTGFNFTGSSGNQPNTAIVTNFGTSPGRIDHNTFNAAGTNIFMVFNSIGPTGISYPLLVDHNTISCGYNATSACEAIHNEGATNPNSQVGWTNNVTIGGPNMVFIEDNTFTQIGGNLGNQISALEQFYGSQTVFRHNTLNNCAQVDAHGTAGLTGARWWDINNNQFNNNSFSCPTNMQLRGGSGVVWNNVSDGTSTNSTPCGSGSKCFIDIFNENGSSGTWPNMWQPGSGINGNTNGHVSCPGPTNNAPIEFWNNTNLPIGTAGGVAGTILINRDYFTNASQPATFKMEELSTDTCSTSYVPTEYPYPHPLQGGNPVAAPTFSPVAGSYTTAQNVTIATTTPGATLCYTTDGSTPTANGGGTCTHGTTYTTPVAVASSLTLKAVGSESGFLDSSVTSGAYTITGGGSVSFSVSSIAFGSVPQGSPSAATIVTLSNTTGATATYSGLTIVGANAVDFAQANTCNSFSNTGTLPASTNCTISIVFTPSAAAGTNEAASLSLAFTGTGTSPQTIALTGTSGTGSVFLPSSRTIDWTHAGIPGGIPDANWPICQTIPPSGGADDSVTIQNAINTCVAGSVIVLNSGTYTLHRAGSFVCPGKSDDGSGGVYESGLCLTDKSIVLRGAGPNNTRINYGDGANIISMGQTYLSHTGITFTPITSAALKGATTITVSSVPTGVVANSFIVITQNNPNDIDGNALNQVGGYSGSCTYCGHDLPNNVMDQIDEVLAVSGNTLTLQRPLYTNYSNSPAIYHLPMVVNVGLENLRVVGTAASGTGLVYKNINMEACAFCWVHNVESDFAVDVGNFYLSDVYGSEISSNYAFQSYSHNGGAGYGITLYFRASENLIVNNIIRLVRHSLPTFGTSGNVYAYNFGINNYEGESHNFLPETQFHGPQPYGELLEGNVLSNTEFGDFTHGSGGHIDTMFRNYLNMTSNDPDNNLPMTSGLVALNIAYYSNYENVVGNALGPYPVSGCNATVYDAAPPSSKVNGTIWQTGFFDDGNGTTPNQTLSNKVGQTLVRGGNWDCVSNRVVWSNNIPTGGLFTPSYMPLQTLPNSLAFANAPSYFAATGAVWPPINTASTTIVNQIPAQICYFAAGGPGTSLGGNFNPTACYVGAPSVTLTPTSLSFGNVAVGATSASQTVILSNPGAGVLSISNVALIGTNPRDFAQTNNCGSSVLAGGSCKFTVTFTPSIVGAESATISIVDNASGSPHSVPLTGTGTTTVAGIGFSPTSLTFSAQPVLTSSAVQTFTITSNGTATLTISSITVTGTNGGDFSQTNNCTATLAVGATCTVSVTFRPTAIGSRSASISVADNALASPQTVPLSGTAVAAGPVTLSPSTLSFTGSAVPQGTMSGFLNITVSNTTGVTITFASYTFTGTNNGDFLAFAVYNNTGAWTNNGGAGQAWTLGQSIVDSNGNVQIVTTAGTGGTGSHPTWASVIGQATADGTAVWNVAGPYPNGCGATLTNGSTCVVGVAFLPTAAGGTNETATLNVNFTGGGTSPVTAPVTGTSGSGFVVPNLPAAAAQVNLPLIMTHTATNPNGAALNQALLTPTTTYTVCEGGGCNYTGSQLQTALNQAASDCQTNTSLVQLFNIETIHTTPGFTVGDGTHKCAPGKYLRFETNHPELLPADGNRVTHAYAGVMPQIVEDNATGYTIQFAHNFCGFEMRGIGFSNNSSIVSQSNATIRFSDELITATASIPCNIILDQNDFWAAGQTANLSRDGIISDGNNWAVINNSLRNYQYTGTDNQAIVMFCSNGPGLIANNDLSATTENVDIGGNGCAITDGGLAGNPFPNPSNITISSNHIYKSPSWRSYNCGATTGDCGPGFAWVTLSPQPTTSNCTVSQCQENVSFFAASERPDIHPYDNAVIATCANALFDVTAPVLLSPYPTNGSNPFTFSIINTALNSSNAPNGTTTTGCSIQGFYDPSYVPPADGSFQYNVKNDFEMKTGCNIDFNANWVSASWQGAQAEMLIFQEANPVLATLNYAAWDQTCNVRVRNNVWDNGDSNGYGLSMWTALNPIIGGGGAGSSLGTPGPLQFDNNLVYHLGPQFTFFQEWGSHGTPATPIANAQLPDTFFNHNTVLQSAVNSAIQHFDIFQFSAPNNMPPAQTPFLRFSVANNIWDFGQVANGVVAYPYPSQKCQINSGLAVPCLTPAAWPANIPLGTVAGSGAPLGCTNVNATSSFQPNAGPHGVGSSFCPMTYAALGLVNTTINTGSSPISPGVQTVTPASMANISATPPNNVLFIGSGLTAEFVPVTSITGTTFTAPFANAHNSQITTVIGTSLPASSPGHLNGTDSLDVGANGPAVIPMVQWVPSGIPTVPAAVTFVPTSLTFASQALTTTSPAQSVQLNNTSGATLTITSVTITGTNPGDFSQTNNCGSSVLNGGSCTILVKFTPSANGSRSANISVTDSGAGSPQTVPLAGTGFTPTPTISVNPSSLTFVTQTIGTPSNTQAIIVTNTGTAAITFSSISLTGTNPGDYGQTNNCDTTLPVNASCSILVTFLPTAAGTRTATVSIADNVAGSPQTVSLTGTGFVGPVVAPDIGVFGDD